MAKIMAREKILKISFRINVYGIPPSPPEAPPQGAAEVHSD
jgi:hypothetical protein